MHPRALLPGEVYPATGEGAPCYRGQCPLAHCRAQGYRGRCALLPGTVRPGALPSPGLPGKVCPATGTSAPRCPAKNNATGDSGPGALSCALPPGPVCSGALRCRLLPETKRPGPCVQLTGLHLGQPTTGGPVPDPISRPFLIAYFSHMGRCRLSHGR